MNSEFLVSLREDANIGFVSKEKRKERIMSLVCLKKKMALRLTGIEEEKPTVVEIIVGECTRKSITQSANLAFEDDNPEGLWGFVKSVATLEYEATLEFARRLLEDPEIRKLERFAIIESKDSPAGPKKMTVFVRLPEEGAFAS